MMKQKKKKSTPPNNIQLRFLHRLLRTVLCSTREETRKLPGPTRSRDRISIAELLADERCSQAVLQFFVTTDVGRTPGPLVAEDEEDAASEASEWEARDQAEWAWERRE